MGMNNILFYKNFSFNKINFVNYHYTDHRKGSPQNYIALMEKGSAKIVSDMGTIHIKEGDVFYIPVSLPYQSYWYGENISFYSFGYTELFAADEKRFSLQVIECDEKIKTFLKSIPTEVNNVTCRAISLFYEAAATLFPEMKPKSGRREGICEKIKEQITLRPYAQMPQIAKECGISEAYLYSLFKNPNNFRQKILVEKGVHLLLTTDKKVEEIAGMLNFSSASYFRAVMKKHIGKTPSQVRKVNLL